MISIPVCVTDSETILGIGDQGLEELLFQLLNLLCIHYVQVSPNKSFTNCIRCRNK